MANIRSPSDCIFPLFAEFTMVYLFFYYDKRLSIWAFTSFSSCSILKDSLNWTETYSSFEYDMKQRLPAVIFSYMIKTSEIFTDEKNKWSDYFWKRTSIQCFPLAYFLLLVLLSNREWEILCISFPSILILHHVVY